MLYYLVPSLQHLLRAHAPTCWWVVTPVPTIIANGWFLYSFVFPYSLLLRVGTLSFFSFIRSVNSTIWKIISDIQDILYPSSLYPIPFHARSIG